MSSRKIIDARSWSAAAREFFIIVAGVLCALGAQAWWEGRQDRALEAEYLRQLLADTEVNQIRIRDAIRIDSVAEAAQARISAALFTSVGPSADSLATWILDRAWASSSDFQPLTGTFAALQAGGDFSLIRTDSLRAMLVSYTARLAHEERMFQLFYDWVRPDGLARPMPFLWDLFFAPEGFDVADLERLREAPDARAAFFSLQVANANRLNHLLRLRAATDRLHRALSLERAVAPPP